MTTQTLTKNSKLVLHPSQVKKLFDISNYLADLSEELLENSTQYSKEFIRSLRKSEKDAKEGRIKEIKSLRELR